MRKLEFYVPEDHAETVKNAVFAAGAGKIGGYDKCCWCAKGTGQFRPLAGSAPYIGAEGELETVAEIKIEMVCEDDKINDAVDALKKAHPYETPAYQHWKVEN
jgi:hypothetical protein